MKDSFNRKIKDEYQDFLKSLQKKSKKEIIELSLKITFYREVHLQLLKRSLSEKDYQYFENLNILQELYSTYINSTLINRTNYLLQLLNLVRKNRKNAISSE